MRSHNLTALLLLVVSKLLIAETFNSSNWNISHINVDDGLPDSTVFSIQQDDSGLIWMGTTQGVAKFNGYEFDVLTYNVNDPNTISNNNAGNLFLDRKNQLWVGTFGGGLNQINLDTNEVKRFPYLDNDPDKATIAENVQVIFQDNKDKTWVGTNSGLYAINEFSIKHYHHSPKHAGSISHPRVWDILQTKNGDIWLGTSKGLNLYDKVNDSFQSFFLPENLKTDGVDSEFRNLYADDNGGLWIGASTGLFFFDINSKNFQYFTPFESTYKINKIFGLKSDQILIATLDGLLSFDTKKHVFHKNQNSRLWRELVDIDVRNIFADKTGLLWLSTRYSGVFKVDIQGNPFLFHDSSLLNENTNFQSRQINAIEKTTSGNIYIGTVDSIYKLADKGQTRPLRSAKKVEVPGKVKALHASKTKPGLWIGGTQGLYYLEENSDKAIEINEPFELTSSKSRNIHAIEETANGDIWLGLYNDGILHWDPKNKTAKINEDDMSHLFLNLNITSVFEDSDGEVWFGSSLSGLYRFNPKTKDFKTYKNMPGDDQSIVSNLIRQIYQDKSGMIWVATSKGLSSFDKNTNRFDHITREDGLLDDSIQSILKVKWQKAWLGTQSGMSLVDLSSKEVINFGLSISSNNDALIARSSLLDDNGTVYFGSKNGFYTLAPDKRIEANFKDSNLILTSVKSNKKRYALNPANVYSFDHLDEQISFEFSTLDFKAPHKNKYKHRILELDRNWSTETSNREIQINNYKPGTYTLEVQSSNSDGHWNDKKTTVKFELIPAWWDTPLFKWTAIASALMMLFLFHQFRTFKVKQRNDELETKVKQRTEDLVEANRQLEISAHTDYLTGMPNRLAFISNYKELFEESNNIHNLYIVMADIDKFKMINDRLGHEAGDMAIIKIGLAISSFLRPVDLIARWGGEEFIMCLTGEDIDHVESFVDSIREHIAEKSFMLADEDTRISLTFGIAKYDSSMTLDKCIRNADNALYQGKNSGRNQVVIYSEEKNHKS